MFSERTKWLEAWAVAVLLLLETFLTLGVTSKDSLARLRGLMLLAFSDTDTFLGGTRMMSLVVWLIRYCWPSTVKWV
jgi:hypothetical protein